MRVMIGNDSTLACDTKCPSIPIIIQGYTFSVELFQLPLGGANIVHGVQWLKTLGPVTTDYSLLTMSFTYMDQPVSLRADIPLTPSPASAQQIKCLAQTHSISALYQLTCVLDPTHFESPQTPHPIINTHPSLDHLLQRYISLFQEPNHLPPPCTITHHIHLLPQATLVNVRPYRYLYCNIPIFVN